MKLFDYSNNVTDVRTVLRRWVRFITGLVIYGFGIYLTIHADIGVMPWDMLHLGLAERTGIRYGTIVMSLNVIIVAIDWALKERPGFGTIFDALLTGNFTNIFMDLEPIPEIETLWGNVLLLIAGLFIMALANVFCMSAGEGNGPRDALLVALRKRFPTTPVGILQVGIQGFAFIFGRVLGGPLGIGTAVAVLGTGIAQQLVFGACAFEPKAITHRDLLQTMRIFGKRK